MTMKDALVHVDPSTGEELAPLVPHEPTNLGLLDLSDEQIASLEEPVTDEEVRIKPDNFGTIYLCHTGYRRRLNRAFRRAWGLNRVSPYRFDANTKILCAEYRLDVNGQAVNAPVIGEQRYFGGEGESEMTYGDAAQGADSNGLMRCAKALGVALELWDAAIADGFRDRVGVKVFVERRGQTN